MIHIFRLRQIYNDYAKLFAKPAPKCNLVMSRLCLWQLWRDCNIQKKISLSAIDKHIGKCSSMLIILIIIVNICIYILSIDKNIYRYKKIFWNIILLLFINNYKSIYINLFINIYLTLLFIIEIIL